MSPACKFSSYLARGFVTSLLLTFFVEKVFTTLNAFGREFEARILQRGAHAVFGFLYLGLWQADDGKRGQTVGQMDFHRDLRCLHARQGTAFQNGQTHGRRGD